MTAPAPRGPAELKEQAVLRHCDRTNPRNLMYDGLLACCRCYSGEGCGDKEQLEDRYREWRTEGYVSLLFELVFELAAELSVR